MHLCQLCAKTFSEKTYKKAKKPLTFRKTCVIIVTLVSNLGVAQLVARYLGVVEAASSSLVTQTKTRVHNEPSFFFYFLT